MATAFFMFAILTVMWAPSEAVGNPASSKGCNESRKIPMRTLQPTASLDVRPGMRANGVEKVFMKIYRSFASLTFTDTIPDALKEADALDRKLVKKLVLGGAGGYLLLVPCLLLAVIVPVLGLRALWRRYKEPPEHQPETEEQAATRQRASLAFWIPVVLLVVVAIGALLTRRHASDALDSARKQAQYLASNIQAVLRKPMEDIHFIVGPNFNNFSAALDERVKVCSDEAGSVVDDVFATDPLLTFAANAADRLTKIRELAVRIENASNNPDVIKARELIVIGLAAMRAAATACVGTCTSSMKDDIDNMVVDLEELSRNCEIKLPSAIVDLKVGLKKNQWAAVIAKIPTSKNIKEDMDSDTKEIQRNLKQFSDRFNKSLGQLYNWTKRVAKRANSSAEGLNDLPEKVKSDLRLYAIVTVAVAIIITVIGVIYIFGNQCILWRAPTGFLSFKTASWAMTLAVFIFLVSFPMLMVVSSLGTTMGLAMDRKLCSPAMDLGAPTSRPFIKFLAAKLGAEKKASDPAATSRKDDAEMLQVPGFTGSRQHGVGAISESRHRQTVSRRRKRVCVASSSHRCRHSKRRTSIRGSIQETAGHFEPPKHGKAGQQTRRRRMQGPRADHIGGGAGGFELPTDITSALGKKITPEAFEGVAGRFAQCSQAGLTFYKIFGSELMASMAKTILGPKSPWLGLVDDAAGGPKLDALENLGTVFPGIGKDVKAMLEEFGKVPMNLNDIKELSTKAKKAKAGFDGIENMQYLLQTGIFKSLGDIKVLKTALKPLDDAWVYRTAFESGMDIIHEAAQNLTKASTVGKETLDRYLNQNVQQWDDMQQGFGDSAKKVLQVGKKAKEGLKSDIDQFFVYAREQMREHAGDCGPLYVLYMSTVETVCNQGVSLLAIFWCSVLWFLLVCIPATVVALDLSAQFARAAVEKEVFKNQTSMGVSTTRIRATTAM